MTYKKMTEFKEKNHSPREQHFVAHRLADYWGAEYELTEEQKQTLFELMFNWWFEDDNIGNEAHANRWAYELSRGASFDYCWSMKWHIEEGAEANLDKIVDEAEQGLERKEK